MGEPTSCRTLPGSYCARVDTLFNLPGVQVLDVAWRERAGRLPPGLHRLVETEAAETGLPRPGSGVIAIGHGRRVRRLYDIPAFGAAASSRRAGSAGSAKNTNLLGRGRS